MEEQQKQGSGSWGYTVSLAASLSLSLLSVRPVNKMIAWDVLIAVRCQEALGSVVYIYVYAMCYIYYILCSICLLYTGEHLQKKSQNATK